MLRERLLAAGPHRPDAGVQALHSATLVPVSIARAFQFFSDARNLEQLTPPWLDFQILTTLPIEMRAGTLIDYQIDLCGVPIPWRTRVDSWEPGVRFVDRQLAGPYLWWRHEHWFEAVDGGTRVTDYVEYVPRAAWLSTWLVKRDVQRIFAFRQHALASVLASAASRT